MVKHKQYTDYHLLGDSVRRHVAKNKIFLKIENEVYTYCDHTTHDSWSIHVSDICRSHGISKFSTIDSNDAILYFNEAKITDFEKRIDLSGAIAPDRKSLCITYDHIGDWQNLYGVELVNFIDQCKNQKLETHIVDGELYIDLKIDGTFTIVPIIKKPVPHMVITGIPFPNWLPDTDTPITRMIRMLAISPSMPNLTTKDQDSLLISLSLTVDRVFYHRQKYYQIISVLTQRQQKLKAYVTSDACIAKKVLFEAAAILGAIRLALDEILFIAGKRNGKTDSAANKLTRKTQSFFESSSQSLLPETIVFRKNCDWFKIINEYRNVLFHRGWRDQHTSYFPLNSCAPEAKNPDHNMALMPDINSLENYTHPYDWKYTECIHVETIVGDAVRGFEKIINDICKDIWGGAEILGGIDNGYNIIALYK